MTSSEFIQLAGQWRSKQISKTEEEAFIAACVSGEFDELLLDTLESHIISKDLLALLPVSGESRVWEKLGLEQNENGKQIVHRVHFLKTAWFRVAVAVLIILTGVLVYTSFFRASDTGKEMVKGPSPQPNILPGGNKAVLTLADGSQIILDSAATGKLAQQSGATIQKSGNGEIIYAFDKTTVTGSVVYNTMSTPRGGQYQLILPDGSKVWLNAESSVTFPTVFTGTTREIKMTGEAYFEIKPDKTKPFIVKTITDEIQVLGTSFNINAYNDAPVKTSLLEGSIKVNASALKPGQAYINGNVRQTNAEQDIAWKNGQFNFNNLALEQVMPQVARWYNIEVKYMGKIPDIILWGKMGRQLTLQEMLESLEALGVKSKLKDRILEIYP